MSSMACRWWDDAIGLIAEVEENAVIGLGSDHYLIGRRESIVSGFFQLFLQFEQMFWRTEKLCRRLRASRIHSRKDQDAGLLIGQAFTGQHGDQAVDLREPLLLIPFERITRRRRLFRGRADDGIQVLHMERAFFQKA